MRTKFKKQEFKIYCRKHQKQGFTLVEMIVALSIVAILAVITASSFSAYRGRALLNRAARKLALDLRGAQNMALAVASSETGTTYGVVGVYFSTIDSDYYFLFADNGDGKYDAADDSKIGSNIKFPRGVYVSKITDENGAFDGSEAAITFAAPEAKASFWCSPTTPCPDPLVIVLNEPTTNDERKIYIYTSGQISIKQ